MNGKQRGNALLFTCQTFAVMERLSHTLFQVSTGLLPLRPTGHHHARYFWLLTRCWFPLVVGVFVSLFITQSVLQNTADGTGASEGFAFLPTQKKFANFRELSFNVNFHFEFKDTWWSHFGTLYVILNETKRKVSFMIGCQK